MSEFIFCIDSDGCAMDTMTYKHELFFGPLAIEFFGLKDKDLFQNDWERVNLYSKTRGVNRFTALAICLENAKIDGIENLKKWALATESLSNASLKKEIDRNPSADLKNALEWSEAVNHAIKNYEGDSLAFNGAEEGLEYLKTLGKVYIVSSANKEAVIEEWKNQNLIQHIDDIFCQDRGKKEDIIANLILEGNQPENILMIGDSPGDCFASEVNKVNFYPILVGKEMFSWQQLTQSIANEFISKKYSDTYHKDIFWHNLENIK